MSASRRPDGQSRPTDALRRFGIENASIRRIRSGLVSWHWDIRTHRRRFVLRRYNPWRKGVAYEHRVLEHLHEDGWPVAAPIRATEGGTIVEVDGEVYALFPRLSGRPRTSDSTARARERGTLLADMHATLRPLVGLGQREGSARMHEYAERPHPPNGRTFAEILPSFLKARPDLGRPLARHHERLAPALADCSGLPSSVVHGDFGLWNLLFVRGHLTGILDFDFTRLDLRMADVSISTRFDDDHAMWSAFVGGYLSRREITDAEVEAFVPLRMARGFTHTADALSWWEAGRDDKLMQVERGLRELERDEASQSVLMSMLEATIAHGQVGSGRANRTTPTMSAET